MSFGERETRLFTELLKSAGTSCQDSLPVSTMTIQKTVLCHYIPHVRGRAAGWVMSKKQVLLLSIMLAIPVIGLLIVLTLNGLDHGGNMFSGFMVVVVGLTGILCLALGLSPFAVMAFYPADGFASLAPPPPEPSKASPGTDDEDEDDDDFGDDESMDVDDEFADDEYGDDEDEVFDDGEEYEDEDEELW